MLVAGEQFKYGRKPHQTYVQQRRKQSLKRNEGTKKKTEQGFNGKQKKITEKKRRN